MSSDSGELEDSSPTAEEILVSWARAWKFYEQCLICLGANSREQQAES